MNKGISVDVDVNKLLEGGKHHGDFHLRPHVDVDKILPKVTPPAKSSEPVKPAPGRKGAIKWVK